MEKIKRHTLLSFFLSEDFFSFYFVIKNIIIIFIL